MAGYARAWPKCHPTIRAASTDHEPVGSAIEAFAWGEWRGVSAFRRGTNGGAFAVIPRQHRRFVGG
jgi:hypothetical protein